MEMTLLLPDHGLASRLARWASQVDHCNDLLFRTLLRFDDHVRAPMQYDLRALHAHAQRMRNTVVPTITVAQVQEFDAILDDPAWRDPSARIRPFSEAYFAERYGAPMDEAS